MATFLELAKDLARESGTVPPASITTVTGLSGRPDKVVGWVRKAWTNIQNSRHDWRWMQGEFTSSLVPGLSKYSATSLNISARWGDWIEDRYDLLPLSIWNPELGPSDEGAIQQITFSEWFQRYGRNQHDANRPTEWAIHPDGSLVFGATPDRVYGVRGLYMKSPQTLSANDDVPEMPPRYHEIIVLEAHRLLMIADGAYQESAWPQQEYIRMRYELERDQLPEVRIE